MAIDGESKRLRWFVPNDIFSLNKMHRYIILCGDMTLEVDQLMPDVVVSISGSDTEEDSYYDGEKRFRMDHISVC